MSEERYVWYRPLGRLGDEAIDLFSCRRFVADSDDHSPYYLAFYYQSQKSIWMKHTRDEEYVGGPNGLDFAICSTYEECRPETVAHELLYHKAYGSRLPEELEAYREHGDFEVYRRWLMTHGDEPSSSRVNRPIWDGRRLMFGNRLCKEFKRKASNQMKILDAFESNAWTPSVSVPTLGPAQYKDTVDSMNSWKNSPLIFRQNGRRVDWEPKRSQSKTSNSS